MYFNGSYLRVLTPRTTNGSILKIINGEVQYKESFLPLTAKKQVDKKNARLAKNGFGHLVAIVEVVGDTPQQKSNPRPAAAQSQTEVQAPTQNQSVQTETNQEVVGKPRKPNPKPKKQQ